MVDDLDEFDDAVALLAKMEPQEAVEACVKYGRPLLRERPEPCTMVLVDQCAALEPPAPPPDSVMRLFLLLPKWGARFCEGYLERRRGAAPSVVGPVAQTLLHLYLEAREREKALKLLGRPDLGGALDDDMAMLLCEQFDFDDGAILLLERGGRHLDVARKLMQQSDHERLLDFCRRRGEQTPQLWVKALNHLARLPREEARAGAGGEAAHIGNISEVIAAIERERLLPPMAVLQSLSKSEWLPLKVAKEYFHRQLAADKAKAEEAEADAARYAEDAARMEAEMAELAKPTCVSTLKCSACSSPLDLPAVHFLCMHSFHRGCLADADAECPVCAPQRRRIRAAAATSAARAGQGRRGRIARADVRGGGQRLGDLARSKNYYLSLIIRTASSAAASAAAAAAAACSPGCRAGSWRAAAARGRAAGRPCPARGTA